MRMVPLTIVIPTLNEESYLPRLLRSVADQTFDGDIQVIVVDGHSTDATVERALAFQRRLTDLSVIVARPDIGHQRNIGAAKAQHDYLLFLDADVRLPPGFLTRLMRRATSAPPPLVATVFHIGDAMSIGDYCGLALSYGLMGLARLAGTPVTIGDCLLTTLRQHKLIGGFREDTVMGEDTDYGIRSFRAGARYRCFLQPAVIASDRRLRAEGRLRLLLLWSKVFLHVRRKGPIRPGDGIVYPYGRH